MRIVLIATIVFPEKGVESHALPDTPCGRLAALQKIVGGPFEALPLLGGRFMLINEDGKRQPLPANPAATEIARTSGLLSSTDYIAGVATIVSRAALE